MSNFLLLVNIYVYFFLLHFINHNKILGLSWTAATTEGVLVYSLNSGFIFDPFLLEIGITPVTTRETLFKKEYASGECNMKYNYILINYLYLILNVNYFKL
jgi:hypothetical protein